MSEGDENGINTIKIHKYKSLPSRLGKSYFSGDSHQTLKGIHHTLALCFFVLCVFAGPQTLSRDRCRCQRHQSLQTSQWVNLSKYFRYHFSHVARFIDGSKMEF